MCSSDQSKDGFIKEERGKGIPFCGELLLGCSWAVYAKICGLLLLLARILLITSLLGRTIEKEGTNGLYNLLALVTKWLSLIFLYSLIKWVILM